MIITEPEPRFTPVLVSLADQRFWYAGSTIIRKKGELEFDQYLVEYILKSRLPFAIAKNSEWAQCDNSICLRIFARLQTQGDDAETKRYQDRYAAESALAAEPAGVLAAVASVFVPPTPAAPKPDPLKSAERISMDERYFEPI